MSENSTTFHVKKGDRGLWYVTSPDHRGLLIAGDTMQDALQQVPRALDEMEAAEAAPPAWMSEIADLLRAEAPNDMWTRETAVRALRLAIERGHLVETEAPPFNLEGYLRQAWQEGWLAARNALATLWDGEGNATTLCSRQQYRDVSAILKNLPTREG